MLDLVGRVFRVRGNFTPPPHLQACEVQKDGEGGRKL